MLRAQPSMLSNSQTRQVTCIPGQEDRRFEDSRTVNQLRRLWDFQKSDNLAMAGFENAPLPIWVEKRWRESERV